MTIKGTLETFNLRELLQMLAFNQKVGTLVLETEDGPRHIHVERGRAALVGGDPRASRALLRVVRRWELVPPERLSRPIQIQERSGEFLGDLLLKMGLLDEDSVHGAWEEAFAETFLDLALTSIQRFEFREGEVVGVDGNPGEPIPPAVAVEGLLLDLTRRLDQWAVLAPAVPTFREIYEGTGIQVDLSQREDLDPRLAERVVAAYDGLRPLDAIVEASDVDRLSVLHVTAALLEGGGLVAVSVDDLLSRGAERIAAGEARAALPLLRRAVEREGAPPEVRLRLADAWEACGDPAAAAAELDTYVERQEGQDPVAVFDALERALRLRDGDFATAARLCDHYLDKRPWLRECRERAAEALRVLLLQANRTGRPLEAADRLEKFLKQGEAPSEDLLVLADLYVAGDQRLQASFALFRRAEILLAEGRVPAARTLLQRSLELDGSRSDARHKLREIEGREERRRKKRRVAFLLTMLVALVVGGVAAIRIYGREVEANVRRLREPAESAVAEAERQTAALRDGFEARVAAARTSATPDPGLLEAQERLLADVKDYVEGTEEEMHALIEALESFGPREGRAGSQDLIESLQARSQGLLNGVKQVVAAVRREAEDALVVGERAYGAGKFHEAHRALLAARNLGVHDPGVPARASQMLAHVERYIRRCEEVRARMRERIEAGDVAQAFVLGVDLLADQLDSDVTQEVTLPVQLASTPEGAEVWLGNQRTTYRTPCVLPYSPFGSTELRLRLPGRTPWSARLPSFKDITAKRAEVKAWRPELEGTLVPGVRWRTLLPEGGAASLWDAGGVPLALSRDGTRVFRLDATTGRTGDPISLGVQSPVRRGGTTPGKLEWRILGTRTLRVLTPGGATWEVQVVEALEHAPAVAEGIVVVVDAEGTVTGYRQETGQEAWKQKLGVPPTQAPLASPLGFLLTGSDGSAWAFGATDGRPRRLVAAGRRCLALPLGDGAVVLGSGGGAARRFAGNGAEQSLGEASPVEGSPLVLQQRLVAWVEGGSVRLLRPEDPAPVSVPALGRQPVGLAAAGSWIYAVDAGGRLRAVDLGQPDQAAWEVEVGGAPTSSPIVIRDAVFLLVDGAVVAVER